MEGTHQICENCQASIPSEKIDLHFSYCRRNIKKCETCNRYFDINDKQEHIDEFHTNIKCKHCHLNFSYQDFPNHEKICGPVLHLCSYCDQRVPQDLYDSHLEACGARTKICNTCGKPVPSKDLLEHEEVCIIAMCDLMEQQQREENQGINGKKRQKKEQIKPRSIATQIFRSLKQTYYKVTKTNSKKQSSIDLTEILQKKNVEKKQRGKLQKQKEIINLNQTEQSQKKKSGRKQVGENSRVANLEEEFDEIKEDKKK